MPLVVLSEKVQPEVLEQWKRAKEESEAQTGNQFVELILERWLNPKVKTVEVIKPTAEQEQEIQNFINEIGRLKTEISLKNDRIEAQEETLNNLGEKVSSFEPGENQSIITFPPVMQLVIDKEAAIAQKKAGKTFSRQDILLNCFWETITDGRYIPYKIWSGSELAAAARQIKAAAESV